MCGRNASGGVQRRGARRTGAAGLALEDPALVELALAALPLEGREAVDRGDAGRFVRVGGVAGFGGAAGMPWMQVDRGRSHISQ